MYLPRIDFLNINHLSDILRINEKSGVSWSEDVIKADLKNNSQNEITYIGAFATTTEASLLGYAALGREKKFGLLMALAVDDDFRRMGIGTQLLLASSDCAMYLNMKRLRLKVRKSNSGAIALYKHLSFSSENIKYGYYSNGEDALIMSASLPLKIQL